MGCRYNPGRADAGRTCPQKQSVFVHSCQSFSLTEASLQLLALRQVLLILKKRWRSAKGRGPLTVRKYYIKSCQALRAFASQFALDEAKKEILLLEPSLIATEMAKREFKTFNID